MRKLFILMICCVMLFLGLSWEGDLNPTEFPKWEVVRELHGAGVDYYWIIAKNPDESSAIHFVVLIYKAIYVKGEHGEVLREAILTEYRYFKHGEPYVFNYDIIEDKYWQFKIPDWKRKQCLGCHNNKSKSEEI